MNNGNDLEKFCMYMNEKAHELGMVDSVFNDPAGVYNYSTAKDMLMCLIAASNIKTICDIWSQESDSILIEGQNERKMEFSSVALKGVGSENLSRYYKVLGGKGGTLNIPKIFNSAVIVELPQSDEQLACVVMKANTPNDGAENRFTAAKQAIDLALSAYKGEKVVLKDVCAESAVVSIKPKNNDSEFKILYEKNPQSKIQPASMSKMLTAIVTLEVCKDIKTKVCVEQEMLDMIPGKFYQKDFKEGDIVTVRDLISAMFLPSSNAAAYILGCVVGGKL